TTRTDWVDELLGEIRGFYARYTIPGDYRPIDLQGIKMETAESGVIPLERYFNRLLRERAGQVAHSASEAGLSSLYLQKLREALEGPSP
ncbi:MAG TPA: hypothetical protein PLN52_18150, partial [Opitutaceae bacterium]|nr:hypothetical protein [Opitutaceae bacterium]